MFSGIWERSGTEINLPVKEFLSKSNQEYLFTDPDKEWVIASNDWDFSRTPTTSPAFKV